MESQMLHDGIRLVVGQKLDLSLTVRWLRR
jgi:hypothetical protein